MTLPKSLQVQAMTTARTTAKFGPLLRNIRAIEREEAALEAAVAGKPSCCISITLDGVTFDVTGYRFDGLAATNINPAEPACFEIEQIWIGIVNMTDVIGNYAPGLWEELEERAL